MTKRTLVVAGQVVLSAVFLLAALRQVDADDLSRVLDFAGVRLWGIAIVGLIMLLGNYVLSLRWGTLTRRQLDDKGYGPWFLFQITMITRFFANLLPGSFTSDAYRVYVLKNRSDDLSASFVSVVGDRLIGLLILTGVGVLFVGRVAGDGSSSLVVTTYVAFGAIMATLAIVFLAALFPPIGAVLKRLAPFSEALGSILSSARDILEDSSIVKRLLLYSLLYQLLVVLVFFVAFRVFYDVRLEEMAVVAPLVSLFLVLPLSVNGVGQREAVMVAIASQVSIPAEVALASSLVILVAQVVVSLVGGLFYAKKVLFGL